MAAESSASCELHLWFSSLILWHGTLLILDSLTDQTLALANDLLMLFRWTDPRYLIRRAFHVVLCGSGSLHVFSLGGILQFSVSLYFLFSMCLMTLHLWSPLCLERDGLPRVSNNGNGTFLELLAGLDPGK